MSTIRTRITVDFSLLRWWLKIRKNINRKALEISFYVASSDLAESADRPCFLASSGLSGAAVAALAAALAAAAVSGAAEFAPPSVPPPFASAAATALSPLDEEEEDEDVLATEEGAADGAGRGFSSTVI